MSLRNEQCNKVCRILDDVLANRPTERDFLIIAVRKAFGALEPKQRWIPCSERLPEADGRYLVTCSKWGAWTVDWNIWHNEPKPSWLWEQGITAWTPLPEPYKGEQEGEDNDRA